MIEFKQIEDGRRRCIKTMIAVHGDDMIERVIPVAFPVHKSTWKIRLRVEKTTGLVDRHILTAVKRFGPISASGISELMGWDETVVERSLNELSRVVIALQHKEFAWVLPEDAEIQHFFVEQIHGFAFVSNGLTGDFLPLVQTRALRSVVLGDDELGKLHLMAIRHVASSAESDLIKEIASTNRAHRFAEYGIPDGYLAFEGNKPESEFAEFVLAYMLVLKGGKIEVLSASESAFHFDCPQSIAEQYLANWKSGRSECEKFEGIGYSDKGNRRLLTVHDESLWVEDGRQEDKKAESVRLLRRMTYPGWICDGNGGFHRLVPGDEKTAYRLAIMRGCSLLRRSYAQIKTDRDIARIADEYHDECSREFSSLKKLPDFCEVLKEAVESHDGNVAEIARHFVPRIPAIKNTGRSAVRFLRSQGRTFQKVIVNAIESAKISIMIMSPILDEEGVFEALERARARGVRDIYVVTQLSEHRNNIFKTDPQFINYELPRRKLAALGAYVRDCNHTVHAKMLVVDSFWAFITTANLNANSLGVGKVNALEVALEYRDGIVARVGEALFWEVWNNACYRQIRTDDRISITTSPQVRDIRIDFCLQYVRGSVFLLSSPENQLLVRKLCAMIASAVKYVDILSMSFYDLEELPQLFNAMRHSLKRGVRIRVGVRPGVEMNFNAEQWPDPSTKKLCKAGVELIQCDHLHAKGVVVDGTQVLMTSANFNPFSLGCSQTAHIEMAVFGTTTHKPLSEFADFVKKVLDR